MQSKWYVIDARRGYVSHEGNEASCHEYVRNATSLFSVGPFYVVDGAKNRDATIKDIKNGGGLK